MNIKHNPLQRNKYEQEIVDNSGQLWLEYECTYISDTKVLIKILHLCLKKSI